VNGFAEGNEKTMAVRGNNSRRALRSAALGLLMVLPLAGCGTRVSDESIAAADGSGGARAAAIPTDGTAATTSTGTTGNAAPAAAAAPAGVPAAGGATATGNGTVAAPAAGTTTTTTAAGPSKSVGTTNGAAAKTTGAISSGTAAGAAAGGGPSAPCQKPLDPVILGQTAPTSGIIGLSTANLRSGLALWARSVNARGGVQCHPVQVYQMDDGADPARVASNLNELVFSRHAIVIVGIGIPTTFPGARQFAERNKIPFIGGDLIEPAWFSSPWLFPQGGSALADYAGAMREAAASNNARTAGLVYCTEASICGVINQNFEAMAAQSNLKVVLRKVTSITAPDYTAECQALKSANAQMVFYSVDGSGDGRMARSCRALDYSPPVATAALAVSEAASKDPNLQAQGVYLGTGNAPFKADDVPGAKEFQEAYNTYAAGSSVDQNSMSAWSAGKMFEAAIANVYEKARSGSITKDLILEGLWKVKNETLAGLAPGMTYNKSAPPTQNDCYFTLTINTKGYQAPKGSKATCFKGLPKGF